MNKRTILITGATRGIGWAIAQKAAQANHKVILTGRDPLSLKSRVEELKKISQNRNPSYSTRCF